MSKGSLFSMFLSTIILDIYIINNKIYVVVVVLNKGFHESSDKKANRNCPTRLDSLSETGSNRNQNRSDSRIEENWHQDLP